MINLDSTGCFDAPFALMKPQFAVHRIIIRFNGWKGAYPACPFIMLSTLDENRDAKLVTNKSNPKPNDKPINQRKMIDIVNS